MFYEYWVTAASPLMVSWHKLHGSQSCHWHRYASVPPETLASATFSWEKKEKKKKNGWMVVLLLFFSQKQTTKPLSIVFLSEIDSCPDNPEDFFAQSWWFPPFLIEFQITFLDAVDCVEWHLFHLVLPNPCSYIDSWLSHTSIRYFYLFHSNCFSALYTSWLFFCCFDYFL